MIKTSVCVAAALVAVALLVTLSFSILPQGSTGNLWIVNKLTGHARLCLPPHPNGEIECLPWSQAVYATPTEP